MTNTTADHWESIIAHVDLDCFFAQAEMLDDPALRGHPVIVGPTPPVRQRDGSLASVGRGIVSTANYEARAFGVRTAMPAAQAVRLCPHAHFIKPRGSRYRELSNAVFASLEELTPIVRPVGIDEAYLDLAGLKQSFIHAESLHTPTHNRDGVQDVPEESTSWINRFARHIQRHVYEQTGLDLSVGIGPNRFIAKLASDYNKPKGIYVVPQHKCASFCRSLDIRDLRGIGPASAEKLNALGFRTPSDILDAQREDLQQFIGDAGAALYDAMIGTPGSVPDSHEQRKSISRDRTFSTNIATCRSGQDELIAVATGLLERALHTLRRDALRARTLGVRIRFADFETVQHDETLSTNDGPGATDLDCDLIPRLPSLVRACIQRGSDAQRRSGVRLVGVKLTNLSEHSSRQGSLFTQVDQPQRARVYEAVDTIRAKLGHTAVRSARTLNPRSEHDSHTHKGRMI